MDHEIKAERRYRRKRPRYPELEVFSLFFFFFRNVEIGDFDSPFDTQPLCKNTGMLFPDSSWVRVWTAFQLLCSAWSG